MGSVKHLKLDKDGKKPSGLLGLCKFGVFVLLGFAVYFYVPYGGKILFGFGVTVVLLLFVLITYTCFMLNPNQKKAAKMLMGDQWHCCAGQFLEIKRKDETTSDLIVPREWVKSGILDPVKPVSVRRSVDMTITAEFKSGSKYADDINKDDPNKPIFHCHADDGLGDLKTADEFWTSYPHYPSMPVSYSLQERISGGWFSPVMGVDPEREDVLGSIVLLSLDKSFYEKGDRIYRLKGYNQMNADVKDPEADGKVIARFGYKASFQMGNYLPEHADSFIFRGDLTRESGLKIIHTYRIVVPPKQVGGSSDSGMKAPLLA